LALLRRKVNTGAVRPASTHGRRHLAKKETVSVCGVGGGRRRTPLRGGRFVPLVRASGVEPRAQGGWRLR